MCGILACISSNKTLENAAKWKELVGQIDRRGPCYSETEKMEIFGGKFGYFHSSVLNMRPPLIRQPVKKETCLFQYNGEIYNDSIEFGNDTEYVVGRILEHGVLKGIADLRGEYAFIYYDTEEQSIWFGRDCIGRRSLVYSIGGGELGISSVGPVTSIAEIGQANGQANDSIGLDVTLEDKVGKTHMLNEEEIDAEVGKAGLTDEKRLDAGVVVSAGSIDAGKVDAGAIDGIIEARAINIEGPNSETIHAEPIDTDTSSSTPLTPTNPNPVRTPFDNQWIEVPAGFIFKFDLKTSKLEKYEWKYKNDITGDVESLSMSANNQISSHVLYYPYDCINIRVNPEDVNSEAVDPKVMNSDRAKFEDMSADRDNSDAINSDLKINTNTDLNGNSNAISTPCQVSSDLNANLNSNLIQTHLYQTLYNAVSKRLINIPNINHPNSANVAILFSGGLDCSLLAYCADKILCSGVKIDLLNVAFENQRSGIGYETPDRKLGRSSWTELIQTSSDPSRFRFIEINVSYSETLNHRKTVQRLMYPKNTVMDLSIAIAFYFASRGKGRMFEMPESLIFSEYTSSAKVLLSGLGADELFGGYTRHATSLRRGTYQSLAAELQYDFNRLHERNLGRDDRVCSCWGKEIRYPFLDETVVGEAMKCPIGLKVRPTVKVGSLSGVKSVDGVSKLRSVDGTNSTNNDGISKYILRKIAENKGLLNVSKEKKRAIQFGAKSAKMEIGSSKVKGQDLLEV